MESHKKELQDAGFTGKIDDSSVTRDEYSHDASMFELVPQVVIFPKDSEDVKRAVNYVRESKKKHNHHISLTARAAGTDMSGGAINQSVLMDMTEHFNRIFEVDSKSAHVQPGVFYRDFEVETLKHNALMPSFPASRDLCTVGGMVAN
ncbi:MAG: FAD-binding oxidoreductase, partial [Candidatus Saccharimonadales bacterium]